MAGTLDSFGRGPWATRALGFMLGRFFKANRAFCAANPLLQPRQAEVSRSFVISISLACWHVGLLAGISKATHQTQALCASCARTEAVRSERNRPGPLGHYTLSPENHWRI